MGGDAMTEEMTHTFARFAYIAYGKATGFENYQGLPMPAWEDLPPAIVDAWCAVANFFIQQPDVPDVFLSRALLNASLQTLQAAKPKDRSVKDRHYAILITDLEKVIGCFETWMMQP